MTGAHRDKGVPLRDGSRVLVRPLERGDGPLVQAVFDGMGEEARYRRFLGYKKALSEVDLKTLTAIDHHFHEALVALDVQTGEPVGVARMIQDQARRDIAEVSVAVTDARQGNGLGGLLLERLTHRARQEGVRRFTAVLLTHNLAMAHLFEGIGAARVIAGDGNNIELEVELPLETGAHRVALRAAAAGEVHG
jgi:L-amino acid N-acyltransferase YncA